MEFGGTNPIEFNEYYAGGAQVPAGTTGLYGPIPSSGELEVRDFYGASDVPPVFVAPNLTTSQDNWNLRTYLINNGWDQNQAVSVEIPTAIRIGSTTTATAALIVTGPFPNGITIIVNGRIRGKGGRGGDSGPGTTTAQRAGQPGGDAISITANVTIENNGFIAGGGGGGGASAGGGGGGAGGGDGGNGRTAATTYTAVAGGLGATVDGNAGSNGSNGSGPPPGAAAGGQGGTAGGAGATGNLSNCANAPIWGGGGGGGGLLLPGTGGAANTGNCVPGTAGGSAGNTASTSTYPSGAGGGGWGASGGAANTSGSFQGGSAGAGGRAVALNGYVVTWQGSGTRYGATS